MIEEEGNSPCWGQGSGGGKNGEGGGGGWGQKEKEEFGLTGFSLNNTIVKELQLEIFYRINGFHILDNVAALVDICYKKYGPLKKIQETIFFFNNARRGLT